MRLLIASQTPPIPGNGASTRNHYLARALARHHDVEVISLVWASSPEEAHAVSELLGGCPVRLIALDPGENKRLRQVANLLRGKSHLDAIYSVPALGDAIRQRHRRQPFDLIFLESALLGGGVLPEGVPIVIDQHNIEHEVLWRTFQRGKPGVRKLYNGIEALLLRPVEIKRCRAADMVLVTSERDRIEMARLIPGQRLAVVPNGVDTREFSPDERATPAAGRLLMTGTLNYFPNVDGADFFAHQCLPIVRETNPNVTFRIAGKDPLAQVQALGSLPGVTVVGPVPRMQDELAQATVVLAPLRIGGGTRLKILEALAMGKAVVSTSLGAEGLRVEHGRHLLIADDPASFARAVSDLLSDEALRTSLGRAGRALVERRYDWEAIGESLLTAIAPLAPDEAVTA